MLTLAKIQLRSGVPTVIDLTVIPAEQGANAQAYIADTLKLDGEWVKSCTTDCDNCSTPFGKRCARIGDTYDPDTREFAPPQKLVDA